MEMPIPRKALEPFTDIDVEKLASFILRVQKANGEISWSIGGKTDPWDHVESAMGLSIGGYRAEAERAYEWLAGMQEPDGSWWASYRKGFPEDRTKDTNMSSYIAVGIYHHYLITKDIEFVRRFWPSVRNGIEYALSLQASTGQIYWAKNSEGTVDRMALLTGSSSIFMSLKCALALASILGARLPQWEVALKRLGNAIKNRPNLFNMIKSRYSMDWYYPVLCGAVTGNDAVKRIKKSWNKFVVSGWGVRCVSDRPWATMAETAEFVLTLAAIDHFEAAADVLSWIVNKSYGDGSYWMGVTFPDAVVWPQEKTSWTTAAILLAYDALTNMTPAGRLFSHSFWGISNAESVKSKNHSAGGSTPRFGSHTHELSPDITQVEGM
ncbi:MAG: hypothetical protein M0P57_10910 [Syntrophales bacterium]|jgi:hypothetical protein|nr:hypothetical protein [Syntrophales bacterium]MDY0043994.1 hypothetical protein [Syntrophales bacterium]